MNNDPSNLPDQESSPERKGELLERANHILRTADEVTHDEFEHDDNGATKYSLVLSFESSKDGELQKQGFTSGLLQRSESYTRSGTFHPEMTILRLYSSDGISESLMYDMFHDANGLPEVVRTSRLAVDEYGTVNLEKTPFNEASAAELDRLLDAVERNTTTG